ncbi:MAG: RIP metalloprotease RseP [Rhodospirillaceae bacterium]|nr:RIP metalloprotease RseP [Rhodospirillaceae bacterium]|tara:strand:- start:20280 stop:21410 length:1131 start_codon:yes stop_codon:yes gene_type:complete
MDLIEIFKIIIPFLIILTVLVFVHEMGHYWVARKNGVKVEVFAIGFGSELFGWTDSLGTRWKICAIPLGGYVKMFGDGDISSSSIVEDSNEGFEDKENAFHHKSLGARAAIVLAGPAANFLFAIILLAGLYSIVGQRYAPPIIDKITSGSSADIAGLVIGDEVLQVNEQNIKRFDELQRIVRPNPGKELNFLIRRDNEILLKTVIPQLVEGQDASGSKISYGLLGVVSEQTTFIRHNPLNSFVLAVEETWVIVSQTLIHVTQMIRGERTTDELGGPIRIAKLSGAVADAGLTSSIWFMAVLSINLGLINLFPVPVLDGGHLFFYLLEFIRGKPLEAKMQGIASYVGLVLVISLMIFVTWNDLVQLNIINFIRSIVN